MCRKLVAALLNKLHISTKDYLVWPPCACFVFLEYFPAQSSDEEADMLFADCSGCVTLVIEVPLKDFFMDINCKSGANWHGWDSDLFERSACGKTM